MLPLSLQYTEASVTMKVSERCDTVHVLLLNKK